jgi:hypothetical protein
MPPTRAIIPAQFGANGDTYATGSDAAITAGQKTLTSLAAAFSAGDVGKLVEVRGAGSAGATLFASITSVASQTSVVLSAAASTTVSGALYAFGTDDTAALNAMFASVGDVSSTQRTRPAIFWFPPGQVFMTSGPLLVQQNHCHIVGNGAGIRNCHASAAVLVTHADSVNAPLAVHIDGLWVQSEGNGIQAQSAPMLKVRNCHFKDFLTYDGGVSNGIGGIAVYLQGCVSYYIGHNEFDGIGSQAIYVRAYTKTWNNGAGSIITESQGGTVEQNRINHTGSIAVLISEGGGHKVLRNDVENCNNAVQIRSSFDFLVEDNYFENNNQDISTDNIVDLVSDRSIQCGRIFNNQCESQTGIAITKGDRIMIFGNRISHDLTINSGATNTWVGRQSILSGSYTDNGTSTVNVTYP